jgi:excisionase family DNA binding protein
MHSTTTLLDSRLFLTPIEVAALFDSDPRTIRRAVQEGKIPGFKVGVFWKIPTSWVRQQAGLEGSSGAAR